jgi:short-subunit dehydrogenase
LVNNAAVAPLSRFSDLDDADLLRMINVNLVAPMMLTRRLLPGMIARGRGHLVTIASLDGK